MPTAFPNKTEKATKEAAMNMVFVIGKITKDLLSSLKKETAQKNGLSHQRYRYTFSVPTRQDLLEWLVRLEKYHIHMWG
jgi:hypothetical protein